jgi:PhoPQ-activated pathogenicity-related protein
MSSAIETLEQVSDVDEALRHLSLVPASERGEAWHAYLDAILEQRRASAVPAFSDKEIS